MKRYSKLVCCKSCGCDTCRPSGYCFNCFGGYHTKKEWRKRKDIATCAIEVDPVRRSRAEEYNGDTERDDI